MPVEEIAYDLCIAIARNSMNTLLNGMEIPFPLVIAGGCAKNKGIIRAFSNLLNITNDKIIVSRVGGLKLGFGAAIKVKKRKQ